MSADLTLYKDCCSDLVLSSDCTKCVPTGSMWINNRGAAFNVEREIIKRNLNKTGLKVESDRKQWKYRAK